MLCTMFTHRPSLASFPRIIYLFAIQIVEIPRNAPRERWSDTIYGHPRKYIDISAVSRESLEDDGSDSPHVLASPVEFIFLGGGEREREKDSSIHARRKIGLGTRAGERESSLRSRRAARFKATCITNYESYLGPPKRRWLNGDSSRATRDWVKCAAFVEGEEDLAFLREGFGPQYNDARARNRTTNTFPRNAYKC